MAYSVSYDGPYFSSGPISFSQLRDTFGIGGNTISLSSLIRDTNQFNPDPRVPDATENATIAPTRSNVTVSGYRNAIKQYFLTWTGNETNPIFQNGTWNSNLSKNILKKLNVTGGCISANNSSYAATFNAQAFNLKIDVSGYVAGAGGPGGTVDNGSVGGPAFFVSSSGTAVRIIPRGPIYGGGGGGAKGFTGATGAAGVCSYVVNYNTGAGCNFCPGCGADVLIACTAVGRCNCRRRKRRCRSNVNVSTCQQTIYYGVPGGPGGASSNGGNGQGWDLAQSCGTGAQPGTVGGCPNYGASGDPGQDGACGGTWGQPGQDISRYGVTRFGGTGGRAITGSNYFIDDGSFGGNAGFLAGTY